MTIVNVCISLYVWQKICLVLQISGSSMLLVRINLSLKNMI